MRHRCNLGLFIYFVDHRSAGNRGYRTAGIGQTQCDLWIYRLKREWGAGRFRDPRNFWRVVHRAGDCAIIPGRGGLSMLGFGYLAIAAARTFSIVFDKSTAQSNLISLAIEIVLGVMLVL